MLINENAKIERVDLNNIGLFVKSKNGKWRKTGKYWPTFEKAVKGVLQIYTIDQITYAGDCQTVLKEIKSFHDRLDEIANKILSGVDITTNYGLLSPMIKESIDFDIMEKDLYE